MQPMFRIYSIFQWQNLLKKTSHLGKSLLAFSERLNFPFLAYFSFVTSRGNTDVLILSRKNFLKDGKYSMDTKGWGRMDVVITDFTFISRDWIKICSRRRSFCTEMVEIKIPARQ